MLLRSLVAAAAWLEIAAGIAFLAVFGVACQLLFATTPAGTVIIIGRLAGIGILALGITCLFSEMKGSQRSAAWGLFIFNSGIVLLFAWTAVATTFRGVLLWPFTVLHAVVAAALLSQLLPFENLAHSENWDVPNPASQLYIRKGKK